MAYRVFFSFDYEDVKSFRANVVRKHDTTKEDREDAGFFDASLWEKTKLRGDDAIKRLIDEGLEGTSMSVTLIGTRTFGRRWVRYEIVRSMARGSGIFGVHINNVRDKFSETKALGANPFDYLGLRYNSDGTALELFEWASSSWVAYQDYGGYRLGTQRPKEQWGKFFQLSHFYRTFDWVTDDGYNKFAEWVERCK